MKRIGIDPGVDGAIALLNEDLTVAEVIDMPTELKSTGKREVNAVELGKILYRMVHYAGTLHVTVILEQVGSYRKEGRQQGGVSMFGFGDSFGCVRGVCGALKIPVIRITPASWKRKCGLIGKPKDAARTLAQQLYPEVSLARKKDVDRADAILIARYGGL